LCIKRIYNFYSYAITKCKEFKDCRTCKHFSYHPDILGCVLGYEEVYDENCEQYEYSKSTEERYIEIRMFLYKFHRKEDIKYLSEPDNEK